MESPQPPQNGPASAPLIGALSLEQQLQYLLISAADHEVLAHSIACFRRLFAGDSSPQAAAEFMALKWLLNQKLADHFKYEDTQVFPVLLAGNPPPVVRHIAALTSEHVTLLPRRGA